MYKQPTKGTAMSANENTSQKLCQHQTKAGHHCHMGLAPGHPSLCAHHLRVAKRAAAKYAEAAPDPLLRDHSELHAPSHPRTPHPEIVAAELLAGAENLSTAASVNLFLGNLLKQVAHNRISRKNAIAMAYISQLLLNSISVMQRQARDADAAQAHATANEPQHIVLDMPRPCHRPHLDDDDDPDPAANHTAAAATDRSSNGHTIVNNATFPAANATAPVANTVLYTPDDRPPQIPRPPVFRRRAGHLGGHSHYRGDRYSSSAHRPTPSRVIAPPRSAGRSPAAFPQPSASIQLPLARKRAER
jgi:hypothetical protein